MNIEVNLSVGQMCAEICNRLSPNTQIKITPNYVRVQHTSHCDRLLSAASIDQALQNNLCKS